MAKIYETKEDFERDKLKEQAAELRHESNIGLYSGALSFVGAVLAYMQNIDRKPRSILTTTAAALFAASGTFNWTLAWHSHSKANKLDKEREKLERETVILPPGVGGDEGKDCGCPMKSHSEAVGAKTLMEQAAKSADGSLSKT